LSKRLEGARELKASLEDSAAWVDEIRAIEASLPHFEPRMFAERDPNNWDRYLQDFMKSEQAGVEIVNFGSRADKEVKDYVFLIRDIAVRGTFHQLVDFIDRIERGERYVRIEDIAMRAQQDGTLFLRVTLMCFAGETTRLREQRTQGGGDAMMPEADGESELQQEEPLESDIDRGSEADGAAAVLETDPGVGGA